MTYVERSDAQLLELSRQGLASAFCVLVHRHGPTILQHARTDDDPIGATTATFIRAMRTLDDADGDDVAGWLLDLAADELDLDRGTLAAHATGPMVPVATAGAGSIAATIAIDQRLDEVWADLAPRWPSGRRPRHVPSWAIWLGTILVLMALAILLPWAVLGSLGNDDPVIPEVRASPVLEDRPIEEEPLADADEEDEEPLPTFEFPEPPSDAGSEPDPAPEPAPAPEPGPTDDAPAEAPTAPGPTDDAPATPTPDDDPDPSGPEPDDEPADGGPTDEAPAEDPAPAPDPGDDTAGGDPAQPAVTEGENP